MTDLTKNRKVAFNSTQLTKTIKYVLRTRRHIPYLQSGQQSAKDILQSRKLYLLYQENKNTYFAVCRYIGLVPNHFHIMVEVRDAGSEGFTLSEALTSAESATGQANAETSLNYSIGVMLRSYTRAINIQENSTGSLFRKKTKSICLNEIQGITSHWYTSFGITFMKVDIPEYQYPQVCFNYIHANPVKAGLVKRAEDWEFSSYIDLVGMRAGSMVKRQRVEELGLIV